MKVRRVVTGQDASGKSVFVSDDELEPITLQLMPGAEFHRSWGAEATPTLPTNASSPEQPTFFPPTDGFRFLFFTLPPDSTVPMDDLDVEAGLAEFEEKLPGLAAHMEQDNPGMHTTDTVDWDIVISGEVILELDDGAEVHLKPGDCVVQNGTRHRWRNPGSTPAVVAAALVGAKRR